MSPTHAVTDTSKFVVLRTSLVGRSIGVQYLSSYLYFLFLLQLWVQLWLLLLLLEGVVVDTLLCIIFRVQLRVVRVVRDLRPIENTQP